MVFLEEDKNIKQVIVNCNCGCDEQINFKRYLLDEENPTYSISISTADFYNRQRGIFKIIKERLKLCLLALRGKSYRLTDIELSQEELDKLIKNLQELNKYNKYDITISNMAKAIKFMATNPDLTEEEIIDMFSNQMDLKYLDKLLEEE